MKKIYILIILLSLISVSYSETSTSIAQKYYIEAQRYYSEGSSEQAIQKLYKAIQTRADYAEAYKMLGDIYFELHNFIQAKYLYMQVDTFSTNLQYTGDLSSVYYNLSEIWFADRSVKTNLEMAIFYCNKCIAINSNFILAYYRIAGYEKTLAEKQFNEIQSLKNNSDIMIMAADKNYLRAVSDYDTFITLSIISGNPQYKNSINIAYDKLTFILDKQKLYSRALPYLRSWKEINPYNTKCQERLSRAKKELTKNR